MDDEQLLHIRYITDKDGNPIPCPDLMAWAEWFENSEHEAVLQDVSKDEEGNVVGVSTVFLGLNFNFSREGPPILWETLISGGPYDGEIWRYSSLKEAREGHLKALSLFKGKEES